MDISCAKCNLRISQGVRFNAEKKKEGEYYTTPIWSFKFKCTKCKNGIVIKTDPQNARYKVVTGGLEQNFSSPPMLNNESDKKEDKDAFKQMEKEKLQIQQASLARSQIQYLYELNSRRWKDSYATSRKLRDKFRRERHALESQKNIDDDISNRNSLHIKLVSETTEDIDTAKSMSYNPLVSDQKQIQNEIKASDLYHREHNHISEDLKAFRRRSLLPQESYKSMALRSLATKVDMAFDPFLLDTAYNRPLQSKNKIQTVKPKKDQNINEIESLVNYSDSE